MAAFCASGRRLLSTAAAVSEFPVPIARIRSLARLGRLADIDATVAPLIPAHPKEVISALSVVGLSDRASTILSTIPSPTAEHLNSLLGPLLRRRRRHAERVPGLLDAHPSAPRNAVTWSILAKSLCITKGADEAVYLLHGEEPPSLHLYTAIIDSYYKQKKPHRAEELWRDMVDKRGIAPDAAAYNVRITYKSTTGTVEEVKELIRAMREEAGLRPDIVSYNGLLRVLGRHKMVDEALEVYRTLQEKGAEGSTEVKSAPECGTYSCMVSVLCNADRWSEAEDVFYEGLKRRKVADLSTVRKLVVGLNKAGKGRAARRVVDGLRKKFPDQFDGPWKELEKDAGIIQGASNKEKEAEEDEQQPAAVANDR
uniref:Uncharacterized protein n=1 Tax=Avena sativa TaxID=4498 RepID=A0ACD5VJ84_AVESA